MDLSTTSTWQDWVLTVGQLALFVALLPSVFSADKPNRWTSLLTGTVLATFTLTYWTLALYKAAAVSGAVALTWLILFYQKLRQE